MEYFTQNSSSFSYEHGKGFTRTQTKWMVYLTFTAYQCWSMTRETRGAALGKRQNASIRLQLMCNIRNYVYLTISFHHVLNTFFILVS